MTSGRTIISHSGIALAGILGAAVALAVAGCCCCSPASGPGTWKPLPPLPDTLGVARPFAGVCDGVLLLAGGSNFPDKPAAEGGAKVCHDDIFILTADGRWRNGGKLLHGPVAEGIPVATPAGVACLGGMDGKKDLSTAFLMAWSASSDAMYFSDLPPLPKTVRMGGGACLGGQIYVVCGKQDGKVANGVWRLDLGRQSAGWVALPPLPGVPREQPVAAIVPGTDGHPTLCVFGGNGVEPDGRQAALVDGYRYDLTQGDAGLWKAAATVQPKGFAKPVSLLGASAVAFDGKMLCSGGFDKEVWDESCRVQATLKDDALAAYKKTYLSQPPEAFRWNRHLLVYDAKNDEWKDGGVLPFAPRCGAAMAVLPGGTLVIASGEIKPGCRTPECMAIRKFTLSK
jgi:cyclically-permuted mutarotase family protein